MYAVIKTGGKQYRVAESDTLDIERVTGEAGDIIEFKDVLMVATDKGVEVGAPLVDGATVAAELVEQRRAKKILVYKKKRRKNYQRKNGHRQLLSRVAITEILTGGKKPSKKAAVKKAAAKTADEKPAKAKEAAKVDEKPAKKAPAKKAAAAKKAAGGALFTTPDGEPDDLKKISGVGPALEKKLHDLGITKFAQVAAFTKDDIAKVDDALSFKGRIERDDWVKQAAELAKDA
ncbi:MAG: 50S ribosomal protein L21 [Rhizobiales bacterium]|nr:50S ribosomal protein L21 [Hyphomicrobiales bacterium]